MPSTMALPASIEERTFAGITALLIQRRDGHELGVDDQQLRENLSVR